MRNGEGVTGNTRRDAAEVQTTDASLEVYKFIIYLWLI
jgi:hypothetical protein